jgi:hypothetical protein
MSVAPFAAGFPSSKGIASHVVEPMSISKATPAGA